MRSTRVLHAVDSHTEGMPTRVVTGGVGVLRGTTMAERRQWFLEHCDDLRTFLMYEPRGHSAMSGAILQPPTRPDADWGVLYIEVSGCLPMCGHGTIGVATVLVETGMVEVVEPVTTVRLDTPAGLVVAEVAVSDGAVRWRAALPREVAVGAGTPAVGAGGDAVVIAGGERIGVLDETDGRLRWTRSVVELGKSRGYALPGAVQHLTVADGRVYQSTTPDG